jgi:hypothetical protein
MNQKQSEEMERENAPGERARAGDATGAELDGGGRAIRHQVDRVVDALAIIASSLSCVRSDSPIDRRPPRD